MTSRRSVLVHSPRATGIAFPAVSPHLEFEDLIVDWGDAELISPARRGPGSLLERVHNRMAKQTHRSAALNVGYAPTAPEHDEYDLFFALMLGPDDVLAVNAIDRWRERCGVAVAWLVEAWMYELDRWKGHWDLLGEFDHVVVSMDPTLEPIRQRTGANVHYLPTACDTLLFSPKRPLDRPIDVMSIGRRSPVTHAHLCDMASDDEFFYSYDTLRLPMVKDHREHRFMYAANAKRSKFFIGNRSKVETPEADEQHEFGGRFFESAAAGAISIGALPDTDHFRAAFDWPDAYVELAFDGDPEPALRPLIEDPERRELAHRRAIEECLRRHDWVHRWAAILEIAGVSESEGMQVRRDALDTRRAQLS